ncbi:MAG TPA: S26 family signal peptidase [Solirubrobacterales bacterium]|nr:S26 family signal peptidase [Solirubrobacterales bacterium]
MRDSSEVERVPRTTREKMWLAIKIGLGVLALALVVTLALLRTWPPLLEVQTGSMEPTIDPGDVAIMQRLDRPAQVGDVVEVHPPQDIQDRLNYPETLLHRIVRISPGGQVYTKGDARDRRDPFTVSRDDVGAHMVGKVPSAGQILGFFTSPLGLLWMALGIILFVLLPYFELRREQLELEKAELGTLASLRQEVQDVAQQIAADDGGGTRAPPALPRAIQPPVYDDGGYGDLGGPFEGADGPLDGGDELAENEVEERDDLETEIGEIRETMGELVGVVDEYGRHLRSHTEVLTGMSAASKDLADVVAELRVALSGAGATGGEQARHDARQILRRWREDRAAEIAGWMGFREPGHAARLAPLDEAMNDEDLERALMELAAQKPYLKGD